MITVSLRTLHSPDLPDLRHDTPTDPTHFCLLVQAMIGPADSEAADSFDILVCTPSWLATHLEKNHYAWGKHYLILPFYDFDLLWQVIENLCAGIQAPNWDAAAALLSRYGKWEFEGYPHPS